MGNRRKPEHLPQRRSTLASLTSASPIGINGDKYEPFSKLDKSPGTPKGWSGKVLVGSGQGGPLGWSDEVLGVETDEEIELDTQDYYNNESMMEKRPQSLHVEEEAPWQIGLHRTTWDRSPNRSFVRNFP